MPAPTISFDYNGSPVVINNINPQIEKIPVLIGPTTLFNYQWAVNFTTAAGETRDLIIRIYTDTLAAINYDSSNQGALTDSVDIALSNSLSATMRGQYGEIYQALPAFFWRISSLTSSDCNGNFEGDLIANRATPTINPNLPIFTPPAPAVTISITNGVFTNLPYEA